MGYNLSLSLAIKGDTQQGPMGLGGCGMNGWTGQGGSSWLFKQTSSGSESGQVSIPWLNLLFSPVVFLGKTLGLFYWRGLSRNYKALVVLSILLSIMYYVLLRFYLFIFFQIQ